LTNILSDYDETFEFLCYRYDCKRLYHYIPSTYKYLWIATSKYSMPYWKLNLKKKLRKIMAFYAFCGQK